MADSLQDQLRALGLAKNKPAESRKKRPRKPPPGKRKNSGPAVQKDAEIPLSKAYALREQAEKKRADEARRKKQAEDRKRREVNRAIKAVVGEHRLNDKDAEVARHFMFRGRIRKLYVTPEQNRALTAGEMGLVYLTGGYHVLAEAALEDVRKISAENIVDLGGGDDEEEFPVPDDIDW
jgi:uncharacterized protein YaiL (DUF2058 family)